MSRTPERSGGTWSEMMAEPCEAELPIPMSGGQVLVPSPIRRESKTEEKS